MSSTSFTKPTLDKTKLDSFMSRIFSDLGGTYVTLLCAIGDRLNLFKDLAANSPATSQELSQRTKVNERYAREWLSALTCAGYLEFDSKSMRFTLPLEHSPALADEGGPMFMGGIHQELFALTKNLNRLVDVFQKGGGIPIEEFDENEFAGTERFTATWFENYLLQQWIPAVPDIQAKLEQGALVADVGCGRGRALIKLARAYPNSRFVGYDIFEQAISKANTNAVSAGVSDRVRFVQLDVTQEKKKNEDNGMPNKYYDIITTFDVVHDMVNPRAALHSIRKALKDNGTYLMLEINAKDKLEDNIGPLGAFFYSMSVLYCMTVSLAAGGEGLGTAGLPESKVRQFCNEAGFSRVNRAPIENPFNVLYEIRP
jgi:2-polyprenyl-3-methyl-5-hydroxy-6-metoxy-1,4-benzoquinol methylase